MHRGTPCQTVTLLCLRPTPHHAPWRSLPALPLLWTAGPAEPRGLRPGGQATLQQDIPLSSRDVARGDRKAAMRGTAPTGNPLEQEGAPVAPLLLFLEELEAGAGAGQEHPEALCAENRLS